LRYHDNSHAPKFLHLTEVNMNTLVDCRRTVIATFPYSFYRAAWNADAV